MRLLVLICAFTGTLTGCDFVLFQRATIVDGEFRGLVIGSPKEQVLEQIRKLSVHSIRPAPSTDFRVKKTNIEDLEKARQVDGIRLMGKPGIAIDLFFKDSKVWHVRKSVPAASIAWFSDGMDRATATAKLRELLEQDSDWEIVPIVFHEGSGWISIEKTRDEARRRVLPHDAWSFEISTDKPAGAFVTVYFRNNTLNRIEYRRPRVRLD
jgi:hypothetical protein